MDHCNCGEALDDERFGPDGDTCGDCWAAEGVVWAGEMFAFETPDFDEET